MKIQKHKNTWEFHVFLVQNNKMFMGALTENYIANEFTSYGLPLNYYTFSNIISKKTALQEHSFSYILI